MKKQTMGGNPVNGLVINPATGWSARAPRDRTILAVNELDINAEAQADGLDVEVTFYGPMGCDQMTAVFHGDADLEKVAQICEGIRALIDKKI